MRKTLTLIVVIALIISVVGTGVLVITAPMLTSPVDLGVTVSGE